MRKFRIVLAAACAAFCLPALAHVVFERPEAPVGASYKAVLRVTHGCDGAATTAIRVRIPEGVIAVRPMPKPGWTISLVRGPYAKTYDHFHGAKLSEGVVEISWSGGNLPDDHFDEFVFQGFLARSLAPGSTLYFPVVQECEKGEHRWTEVPAGGRARHLHAPAPGVKILPRR